MCPSDNRGCGVVASKRKKKHAKKTEPEQIFKYWVEIRDLNDNTVRTLPLTGRIKVALIEPTPPSKRVLWLENDSGNLEANDFEELRAKLREKYPDDAYERTIHWERDIEAEQRREHALNGLAMLMAEAAVEEALGEQKQS